MNLNDVFYLSKCILNIIISRHIQQMFSRKNLDDFHIETLKAVLFFKFGAEFH